MSSSNYKLLEIIGKGSFGVVHKALHIPTGRNVACKIIDMEADDADEIDDIMIEIQFLRNMEDPHITRLYEAFTDGPRLWIVMEYIGGGSGVDLLANGQGLKEDYIAIIARECLLGLLYLHNQNKIHRDIKAANVLFTVKGDVKLADFGVGGQLTPNQTRRYTLVGTPYWMAPEVIAQTGATTKADIWSFGITLIEFAQGEPPLSNLHPMKALIMIPSSPSPTLTGPFSKDFKDFVNLCLQKDPAKRPTAEKLLKHKFVRNAKKCSYMSDFIKKAQAWREPVEISDDDQGDGSGSDDDSGDFDFATMKPKKKKNPPPQPAAQPQKAAAKPQPNTPSHTTSSSAAQKPQAAAAAPGITLSANPQLTSAAINICVIRETRNCKTNKLRNSLNRLKLILKEIEVQDALLVPKLLDDILLVVSSHRPK